MLQVASAVSEDALYLLVAEFEKGLEDATRRPAAAVVVTHFCSSSKLDYQEHVPSLLTVRPAMLCCVHTFQTGSLMLTVRPAVPCCVHSFQPGSLEESRLRLLVHAADICLC